MPRRLEIRTTILGKKSEDRTRRKDANANDLYADEALQLLEQIEQLKSNIQKTDERILGTYTVKSPSKAKKKKSDVPARKVAYDVFYPAMDAARSRVEEEKHGRRGAGRDTVVSHCLNAGGASAMAYSADDDDDDNNVTPSGLLARPWTSCTTNFTPAPTACRSTEPSHGPSFWPVAATRRRTQPSTNSVDESGQQSALRHDVQQQQHRAADDNRSATGGASGNGDTNTKQLTGRGSSFKRIYATNRAATERNPGETKITRGGSATASSHDHDQRIEQRQQQPTAGGDAGGRQDGHVGDGGEDDDDGDREDKRLESSAISIADGENSGHASMPLNSTDVSNNLGPQWLDGAEVDESLQPVPPEFGHPTVAEENLPPEQVLIGVAEREDDIGHLLPPEEEEEEEEEVEANYRKAERVRHYDRHEIRQYMQKQKKERKEKAGQGSTAFVCHHTRYSPVKRSDLGLPDKPFVQMKRKQQPAKPALAPYGKAQPEKISRAIPKIVRNEKKKVHKEKELASIEKWVQTEPISMRHTIDEATQMTNRSQVNDSSTDWLHSIPTSRVPASRMASQLPHEMMASSQSNTMEKARMTCIDVESYSRSQFPIPPAHPAPSTADNNGKPKPVTNLIQKIEDLELYIGNLLDASSFQSLKTTAVHPSTVERDVSPTGYRPSAAPTDLPNIRRQVPTKLTSFRPPPPSSHLRLHPFVPMSTSWSASSSNGSAQTVPDGPTRMGHPLPPPTPPTRISSVKQKEAHQLDTTASTEYHPLPEHLAAFLQLDTRRSPGARHRPEVASQPKADSKKSDRSCEHVAEQVCELSSLFQQLSRHPEATAASKSETQSKPAQQRPTGGGRHAQDEQQPQTYFRDFNEILQMDPNPLTERSNSWKRVASLRTQAPRPSETDDFTLPAAAPYNILSALSDELKATMNRMPRANDNSSDSDFQSRLSVSDISVPDAVTKVGTNAHHAQLCVSSSSKTENQGPKNGSGSRIGVSYEAGSRMTNQLEIQSGRPQLKDETDASQIPLELDTTYLTLTPQYTSFEATASLAMPLDSTSISENCSAENESNNRSMFSTKLSPIPRAISPFALNSEGDTSAIRTEEKQQSTTSSSHRSERERSIGTEENVLDETVSRLVTTTSSRPLHMHPQVGSLSEEHAKKSDELLARLRAEIQRDESLYRSIQHVDRLQDSATRESSKRFRIQIDSQTRTFFEAQTDALRSIAQDVRGGLAANASAFLQGSQAAMEVDRVQNQTRKALGSGRQTYSSEFDEPSVRSSPEIATELPTECQTAKSASQQSAKENTEYGSDSISDRGGLDSSALSDASVLPPKAVDLLLQEEAKQQRLLLKLREKAQVEKTLAELELLQMQKRILRAQGEREKAASIKKKQRGLLLKLQEERARIESLRRQHKKEEQRCKGSSDYQQYDSSSWETDVSAISNSTVGAADSSAASIVAEGVDQSADSSSTSTLRQVIGEAAHIQQQPSSNDEAVDDDAEVSSQLGRSTRSEVEGHECGSVLSNLRLRAPLSPRTTTDSIRFRTKLRRRNSSGSDESINLSQNETASDVSDVESRLMALTDQLQRRQTEAQRLKTEHRRLSKEKLKAQESALIKQIEVYDRCISDLRCQLDADAETGATPNAVLAVRPVIRQPRALIRSDEAKSPTSARSESEAKISESESTKTLEAEGQTPLTERKVDRSSGQSSISTQIPIEAEDHESVREAQVVQERDGKILPFIESAESEKSISELSTDPSAGQDNQAEISDSGRTDVFNQTMIIKSDVQVKEELAEEISKSIFDLIVEETITLTVRCVMKKNKKNNNKTEEDSLSAKSSADVLQRVSALLSTATDVPNKSRSQLYFTTTFDLLSPDDAHSPITHPTGNPFAPPCDLTSVEGRDALESKLNDLRIENEWIDDDLQVAPVLEDSAPDENRDKVIQEAEALEREQKRIEQEIQRLSSGSLLYLREIPNKPPPPYTPPGQALIWQKIRSPVVTENKQIIPKSKDDVARYCKRFTEYLLDNHSQPDIHIPDEYFTVDLQMQTDQPAEWQVNCRAFLSLLADLSRIHLVELSKRTTFLPGQKFVGGKPIRSRLELVSAVESAVLVQMNYHPRLLRENQLARWSQKKRDRVDEILVRELQIEEKFWTDFSSEEVQVKYQTAEAILDLLLDETAFICKRIMHSAK